MSNVHGFDFLKSEHILGGHDVSAVSVPVTSQNPTFLPEKTDGEKTYDVIKFLKAHRTSGCLNPSIIHKSIGVDLAEGGKDENVRKGLFTNHKIRVEEIPDPENPSLTIYTFGYQTKYKNVSNKVGLLAQINRSKHGVLRKDLEDAYEEAKEDLKSLVTGGDILAVANNEGKDQVLFPRGEPFLVELDGNIDFPDSDPETLEANTEDGEELNANTDTDALILKAIKKAQMEKQQQRKRKPYIVNVDVNPKKQIRRGEAVWVGGQWFRVSSAVKEGVSLEEQPERAKAPPSVTLRKDLTRKNEIDGYIRQFDKNHLPLDNDLSPDSINNLKAVKAARAKLQKIAMGSRMSGGTISTLLSSNATAENPEMLAKAVASSGAGSMRRRPPASRYSKLPHTTSQKVAAQQIEEAKKAASDPNLIYSHARRHGCTVDVRDMYLSTRMALPESDPDGSELRKLMVKYKLFEPNEQIRREPMPRKKNLSEDGRPKKKRYYERKGQRITNKHLDSGPLGAFLRAAAEKQQKGESIGDGGM